MLGLMVVCASANAAKDAERQRMETSFFISTESFVAQNAGGKFVCVCSSDRKNRERPGKAPREISWLHLTGAVHRPLRYFRYENESLYRPVRGCPFHRCGYGC